MSYVYIQSEPGLFTVGFYDPSGRWQAESDHGSRGEAADRVAYLNGTAALEARAGAARLHGAFMAARPDDPQFAE